MKIEPETVEEVKVFRRVRRAGGWQKAWQQDPVFREIMHRWINEARRDLGIRETSLAEEMQKDAEKEGKK
jgi:hypothetical protein